ncbi:hypothetical protein EV207_12073 [Scopulibacillus darangshiensis]|uniref:Uncharacterized protein n=1 Tax=Scopulibacillus darangshiensis TaxID=442528 RepID=A0A4R2NVB7_9BACL|nr:hypothetical protein [Scopulibacillus darangshiensis]TCP26039.1 hypothetical protein EV207_12073 [Scopulibacillus darangshiensis]
MTNKRKENYSKMELQMNTVLNPEMAIFSEKKNTDLNQTFPADSPLEQQVDDESYK